MPYLVPDERTKIEMFIRALGRVYADKMIGVIYPTFLDAVCAAMTIETRGHIVLGLEISVVPVRVHLKRLLHHPLLDL